MLYLYSRLTPGKVNIPIVAVFTKYDLLVNLFLRPGKARPANIEREALESFNRSVEELHAVSDCKIIKISMRDSNLRGRGLAFLHVLSADGGCVIEMLLELADVTRNLLHEVEGELWVPWTMAQQASAHQKVELSIEYVSALF